LVGLVKKYDYINLKRKKVDGSRHYVTNSGNLPSVTTILGTSSNKDGIKKWIQKVGEEEANRIKIEASTIGTYMHEYLDGYITGNGYENQTDYGQKAKRMAENIKEQGLCNVDEVWGCEVGLFYPHLYAGTTDVVGVHRGDDAIIDFKQANKPKQREWIQDYLMQLSAYALAHDVMYGTRIKKGVVMMCTRDLLYQEFVLEGESFLRAQQAWLRLVGEFHIAAVQKKQ
jgi:uncharacterized protein YbaA (DUF1428 family)